MTLLSLYESPLWGPPAADASQYTDTRYVGKIELQAVAVAGIYFQFKSATSIQSKMSLRRKNILLIVNLIQYASVT